MHIPKQNQQTVMVNDGLDLKTIELQTLHRTSVPRGL